MIHHHLLNSLSDGYTPIPPPPPPPGGLIIWPVLTISGDTSMVWWESPNYGDNTYKVERRKANGPWITVVSAYSFTNPRAAQGANNVFPYIYYEESGLTSGGAYEYKITGGGGEGTSNAVSVVGTTWYVKNGGSDGAAGTSDATAFASIGKAISVLGAGDIVKFKRGSTFSASTKQLLQVSGSQNNPIRFTSYDTGATPIFSLTGVHGLSIERSHWVISDLELKGSWEINIRIRTFTTSITDVKVINCILDGSAIRPPGSSGAPGGYDGFPGQVVCLEAGSFPTPPIDTSTLPITNVEVGFCIMKNTGYYAYPSQPIHGGGFWAICVTSGAWAHNNYAENNNKSSIDISGGRGHKAEWNILRVTAASGSYGNGSKSHSQQHYIQNLIYRHNRVVNMGGFGLSMQNTENSAMYNNSIYDPGGAYGPVLIGPLDTNEDHREAGNALKYNIVQGGSGGSGAMRVMESAIERSPVTDWRKAWDIDYNLWKEVSGGIVDMVGGTDITPANFASAWTPNHPNDANATPQYTNGAGGDLSLQAGSTALTMSDTGDEIGYNGVDPTRIRIISAVVTWRFKNKIVFHSDKPLDSSYTSTAGITPSGGRVVSSVSVVLDHWLEITVDSPYSSSDTITCNINIALRDKFNGLTFPAANYTIKNGII